MLIDYFTISGWNEALTVKFADGGNKKKNQVSRPWVDHDVSHQLHLSRLFLIQYQQGIV